MGVTEVKGFEGFGSAVSGLIRLWKSVEKPKAPHANPACGAPEGASRFTSRACLRFVG